MHFGLLGSNFNTISGGEDWHHLFYRLEDTTACLRFAKVNQNNYKPSLTGLLHLFYRLAAKVYTQPT